jgi:hypothetical protein
VAQNHIYRTAKGREIDMGKLISQNELVPAVGNMQVNARGDKLTPSAKIPGQINVSRPVPTPAPTPAPTQAPLPVTGKKDITNQDPEGLE